MVHLWPDSAQWSDLADPAWDTARPLRVDQFRPESSNHRPSVVCRLYYSPMGLVGRFDVQDRYVRCQHTQFNESVCQDSCVEFFVQPDGAGPYINFEWNACGVLLASHVRVPRQDHVMFSEEEGQRVEVVTTLKQATEEITEPIDWCLAFYIPFDVFPCACPTPGDTWRANFYKCGDKTSHPHWASWSPVPRLDFHDPSAFGTLTFA